MDKWDKHRDLPEIPYHVAKLIEHMKREHPDKSNLYDVVIYMSLFYFNDKGLKWMRESKDNMDNFALAWILDEWIVSF